MQDLPYEKIVAAQAGQSPIVDGVVIPRDPFDPDAPAISADVPLMAGSNLQDSNLNRTDFSVDDAAAQQQLKTSMGDDAVRVWTAYRAADPKATAANVLARIASDQGIRANSRTVIERKAAAGHAPGFLYLLTWPAPFMGGRYGSVHGRRCAADFP